MCRLTTAIRSMVGVLAVAFLLAGCQLPEDHDPPAPGTTLLQDHGDPRAAATEYVIDYWLPPGASFDPNMPNQDVEGKLGAYVDDMAHGLFSQFLAEYEPAASQAATITTVTDPAPYPAPGTVAQPLHDSDVQHALTRVISFLRLPTGLTVHYLVFLAYDIQVCLSDDQSDCTPSSFDAYHSSFQLNAQPVVYAVLPFLPHAGDWIGQSPNGDALLDDVVFNIAHEELETSTNALGNGWYAGDSSQLYDEIADVCATATLPLAPDGSDVTLPNGHKWIIPLAWSNRTNRCTLPT